MAQTQKTRGTQLIRADRSVPGQVTFYDTRMENADAARIGTVSLAVILEHQGAAIEVTDIPECIRKAALHGWTQNILDASNTLSGDERVSFVRTACGTINAGGWASAPVDEAKAKANALSALDKMAAAMGGMSPEMKALRDTLTRAG